MPNIPKLPYLGRVENQNFPTNTKIIIYILTYTSNHQTAHRPLSVPLNGITLFIASALNHIIFHIGIQFADII